MRGWTRRIPVGGLGKPEASLARLLLLAIVLVLAPQQARAQTAPPGFVIQNAFPWASFVFPMQVVFLPDGRKLVVEKGGIVWTIDPLGNKLPIPFLDISAEVLDHTYAGLYGLVLDPDFETNRWVYMLYTVDPPESSTSGFGRITRYQVSATNPDVADLSTRQVLWGFDWRSSSIHFYNSHWPNELRFGRDKTLLVSLGDGASSGYTDVGGHETELFGPNLADPNEDIGSFRSLSLDSYSGKILRLDKETGLGLPSNPFWDGNPDSRRSRVWTYGHRNAFRFTIRPGTGSTDPNLGDPGVIYAGDVGWNTYEEFYIAHGGENFGWPCYEGPYPQPSYQAVTSTFAGNTNVLCSAPNNPENPLSQSPTPRLWSQLDPRGAVRPESQRDRDARLQLWGWSAR
jgi:glucose/arabinose dehydrogenase